MLTGSFGERGLEGALRGLRLLQIAGLSAEFCGRFVRTGLEFALFLLRGREGRFQLPQLFRRAFLLLCQGGFGLDSVGPQTFRFSAGGLEFVGRVAAVDSQTFPLRLQSADLVVQPHHAERQFGQFITFFGSRGEFLLQSFDATRRSNRGLLKRDESGAFLPERDDFRFRGGKLDRKILILGFELPVPFFLCSGRLQLPGLRLLELGARSFCRGKPYPEGPGFLFRQPEAIRGGLSSGSDRFGMLFLQGRHPSFGFRQLLCESTLLIGMHLSQPVERGFSSRQLCAEFLVYRLRFLSSVFRCLSRGSQLLRVLSFQNAHSLVRFDEFRLNSGVGGLLTARLFFPCVSCRCRAFCQGLMCFLQLRQFTRQPGRLRLRLFIPAALLQRRRRALSASGPARLRASRPFPEPAQVESPRL